MWKYIYRNSSTSLIQIQSQTNSNLTTHFRSQVLDKIWISTISYHVVLIYILNKYKVDYKLHRHPLSYPIQHFTFLMLNKCLVIIQINEWSYLSLTVALEGGHSYFLVTNEKDPNTVTHVLHLSYRKCRNHKSFQRINQNWPFDQRSKLLFHTDGQWAH